MARTDQRLNAAPIGTKAPAIMGGHWIKTAGGWKWFCGSTFPRPGGDWTGGLVYPELGDNRHGS